jgi:hypothetical protein
VTSSDALAFEGLTELLIGELQIFFLVLKLGYLEIK